MKQMISSVVIIVLLLVILLQAIIHSRERKDLYTRLMARDLHEYTYITKTVEMMRTVTNQNEALTYCKKRIKTSYRRLYGEDREV